ncbi:hypothetical protein EHF33_01595 [Deinococcus psychrotolerans]|uniref:Uncharacterized protein n=1 Tax=Deinococcus psychrotolerans TaxID=2489213 RepID=A0A3G8Y9J5_9DEIO|nr:hypothetical protein [Deinococcus psychrotolerans]AZI41610.1 hypothetical protein EHF33_01595 [Deinococcus psychrotolerans]
MTQPDFRSIERARKLLALWRGAVGGEKSKARGALMRVLENSNLTLRDLEAGLPTTLDPEDSLSVREADTLLLALDGSPAERDAALTRLADLPGLSVAERERVLRFLDLGRLVASRADGWVQTQADAEITAEALTRAGQHLTESEVARSPGATLADSARDLGFLRAAQLVRPERSLKASGEYQAAFLASLCAALSGIPASSHGPDSEGRYSVTAHLSVNELSQVRARLAREEAGLRRELLRAARLYGREVGQQKL